MNDIKNWFNTAEGQAFILREEEIYNNQKNRFNYFEKWLKSNDFDNLLYRIINKHNNEYREKCWHNGHEAKPNNVLEFIIDYIYDRCNITNVPELNCEFDNKIWLFKEYYFQLIYGQSTILKIFTKKDLREIFSI